MMSAHQGVRVAAPASKSLSHRALIAAALAFGTSRITNVLESDDLHRTADVLAVCGVHIDREAAGVFAVTGCNGTPRGAKTGEKPFSCFMGESGTSCRLLTAVLAAGEGAFHIHGCGRLHDRPMRPLVDALASLGVSIAFDGNSGFLPFVLHARGLLGHGSSSCIPVESGTSSQFLSGLLLAAPLASGGLTLAPEGDRAVSWPYVGLTLQIMEDFGCRFRVDTRGSREMAWKACDWRRVKQAVPGQLRLCVEEGAYRSREYVVEGDYSGASYLLAAGALGPRPVSVAGLRRESLQGDAVILNILENMGASVEWRGEEVVVSPSSLTGISLDMGACPDLVPTVAAVAAHASSPTVIHNIAHLKAKESDRIQAIAEEIGKTGATVVALDAGLRIEPGARCGREALHFSAHRDHRIAMSLSLFELGGARVSLDNTACVEKSFPEFWNVWRQICPETRIHPR